MSDIQELLALLRRRIALIERKYRDGAAPTVRPQGPKEPEHYFVEEYLDGAEIETPHGTHFESERLFERHRRHGSLDLAALEEMPEDLLGALAAGEIPPSPPGRWAFLDTETTGLAGGSGTYAFLVGVGRITPEGFRVRQFFMREHGEEPSLLYALAEHLAAFDVLVTYNGKTYDLPLLETRFRMVRARPPFERLAHVDLLFGARRLWKLRFESCRLIELESRVLGFERQGDLPGEMIPYVYFEYLRTREAFRVVPIFRHNAMDILTLACLTSIVPLAFRSPEEAPLGHGAELLGLARWLRAADRREEALAVFRRAVASGLGDDLMFAALWEIAQLEKRLGRQEAALEVLGDLGAWPNPHRVAALIELAKHYEHRRRDYARALELTRAAIAVEDSAELRRREARLLRRCAAPANGTLL